jgi:hypothetical protein
MYQESRPIVWGEKISTVKKKIKSLCFWSGHVDICPNRARVGIKRYKAGLDRYEFGLNR